jgi:hypothetical protein
VVVKAAEVGMAAKGDDFRIEGRLTRATMGN